MLNDVRPLYPKRAVMSTMGLSVGCVWGCARGRAAARFIKGLSGAHASAGRDGGEDLTPSANSGGDWHSREPRLPGLHPRHPSPPSASHWPGAYSCCWRRLVTGPPPPIRVRRAGATWSSLARVHPEPSINVRRSWRLAGLASLLTQLTRMHVLETPHCAWTGINRRSANPHAVGLDI